MSATEIDGHESNDLVFALREATNPVADARWFGDETSSAWFAIHDPSKLASIITCLLLQRYGHGAAWDHAPVDGHAVIGVSCGPMPWPSLTMAQGRGVALKLIHMSQDASFAEAMSAAMMHRYN